MSDTKSTKKRKLATHTKEDLRWTMFVVRVSGADFAALHVKQANVTWEECLKWCYSKLDSDRKKAINEILKEDDANISVKHITFSTKLDAENANDFYIEALDDYQDYDESKTNDSCVFLFPFLDGQVIISEDK